jgi:hypothetical protein
MDSPRLGRVIGHRPRRGPRASTARRAALMICTAFAVAAPARAQLPAGVVTRPDEARIVYDDLERFAAAFRRLTGATDTAATLDSAYMAAATPGLRAYARVYGLDGAALAAAVGREPERYGRVASATLARVSALEPAVRRMLERYRELYADVVYPPIYFFLVAHHVAGGTVQPEGVLIATEVYTQPAAGGTPGDNTLDDLVHLVAHELTHYQQAAANPQRYQSAKSLLVRAIKEGAADFIAEKVSGGHINGPAHAYGAAREWELWSRFRCEMHGTDTGDWFFRPPAEPDWPQDLGYFIGYRIVQSFFERQADATAAIAAIIRGGRLPRPARGERVRGEAAGTGGAGLPAVRGGRVIRVVAERRYGGPVGRRGLVQPVLEVRGREYLRLIYGPEYTLPENLERLRARGLGHKRSLALREFALGIEARARFSAMLPPVAHPLPPACISGKADSPVREPP